MQLHLQDIVNGISLGAIYALIALGYTMVYGVLRLINFAHGDIFMVGAYIGLVAASAMSGNLLLVLLVGMAGCAFLGVVIERVAYRPLRQAPRLAALITAIGLSLFLESVGQLEFGADPKSFPQLMPDRPVAYLKESLGVYLFTTQVLVLVLSILLMVALQLLVKRTRFGKAMRAVSQDKMAARLMGIHVDGIIARTFALGSGLAAVAGILWAVRYPSIDPLMGILPGLKAFVAAVIGGIGSVPGAMFGGFLMGLSEAIVGAQEIVLGHFHFNGTNYKDAVAFVFLIIVLLVRPSGIMGRYEPEKV